MATRRKPNALEKLRAKKPRTVRKTLILDAEANEHLAELRERERKLDAQIQLQRRSGRAVPTDELDELQKEIEKAERAVEDASVDFVFAGLPPKAYSALVREHKPSKEQVTDFERQALAEGLSTAQARNGLRYNPDTFPAALVAATMIEPADVAEEEVLSWWENGQWNEAELTMLLVAAEQACRTTPDTSQ